MDSSEKEKISFCPKCSLLLPLLLICWQSILSVFVCLGIFLFCLSNTHIFTGCRIQSFFRILKNVIPLSSGSIIFSWKISHQSYCCSFVIYPFHPYCPPSGCFKDFVFEYSTSFLWVSVDGVLCIYLAWGLESFLNLWLAALHQYWKILNHCLFKYRVYLISPLLSLWNFNYKLVRPFHHVFSPRL